MRRFGALIGVLLVVVAAPAAARAATTALWHMDELSGAVMHDSVGDSNGSLHSVGLGAAGFNGNAYTFNGSSSYVTVPSTAALNPGTSNLTLTMHVKTTSKPATPDWDLLRKGVYTTSGGEYKMEYQPTGQASCGFKGSKAYAELQAGPAINDGRWHTVQCVKTSTAIKVVVDGAAFTKSVAVGPISNSVALAVGSRVGSEFFKGLLDEASVQVG